MMVMETQLNMEDGLTEIKDVINTVVKVQRYMNTQLEKAKGTVKPLSWQFFLSFCAEHSGSVSSVDP